MYFNLGLVLSAVSALAGMTSAAAIEARDVEAGLEVRDPEPAAQVAYPWAFKIFTQANCGGVPADGYSKSGSGTSAPCGPPSFIDYYSVLLTNNSNGKCSVFLYNEYNYTSNACQKINTYSAPGPIKLNQCYTFGSTKPMGYQVLCTQ